MFGVEIRRAFLASVVVAAHTFALTTARSEVRKTPVAPQSSAQTDVTGAGWKEELLCAACVAAGVAVVYVGAPAYAAMYALAPEVGVGIASCIIVCREAFGEPST